MEISNSELKKRLEAYNIDVPPITYSTRDLLIKKLIKLDNGEQKTETIQSKKSIDRNGRPVLRSVPSVTFNPNDETIDGYDVEDVEGEIFEENSYTDNQLYQDPIGSSRYHDLTAEKTRYRKSKSPEARFRNNASFPNVNKTSKNISNEDYPREIYTTDRNSPRSAATYRNVASNYAKSVELHNQNLNEKQRSSCFKVMSRIFLSIVIAIFLVILYVYLTSENKPQLLN